MYYSEPFSLNRCSIDITHNSTIPDCTSCLLWPEHPDIIVPDFFLECQFKMSKILSSTYKTRPQPSISDKFPTHFNRLHRRYNNKDSAYPSHITPNLIMLSVFSFTSEGRKQALNKFVSIGISLPYLASNGSPYQWVNDLCLPLIGAQVNICFYL